ncbi:MAG: trypsin-like peptidase domain-containing protein [Phycisphaerales bacterium]|nr:trypsin-like peptidase domain-containing protein [Phycisphaerales bacterium]
MGLFRTAGHGRDACAFVLAIILTLTGAHAGDSADPVAGPPDTMELAGLQRQFEAIGRQFSPAVVAISVINDQMDGDDLIRSGQMNGQKLASMLEHSTRFVGTGFVIDPEGYILTNEHVVGEAGQLWVTTDSGRVFPAMVIGSDPRADLAVLKIPADHLPFFSLAAIPSRRGQWTIALGNPYGLASSGEMCLSVGVVSAVGRSLPDLADRENRLYNNLIQTTAQINPGNSGGPLLDVQGRVIGINTAVVMPQRTVNGIGFALPITESLIRIVDQLRQGKEVRYGYLGIRVTTPTAHERRLAGVTGDIGARIDDIESESPAHERLQYGDILTEFNGSPILGGDDFVRFVDGAPIGRPARIGLCRDGRRFDLELPIGSRPLPSVAITRESRRLRWRGMVLGDVPPNWKNSSGNSISHGVMVIAIHPNPANVEAGARQGRIFTSIAGQPIGDVIELQRILNDTPEARCRIGWLDDGAVVSAGD